MSKLALTSLGTIVGMAALGTLALRSASGALPASSYAVPLETMAYKEDPTHRLLTDFGVTLAMGGADGYREFGLFREELVRAAVAEDDPPRFVHHFYDPRDGLGLPRNSYTFLFEVATSGQNWGDIIRLEALPRVQPGRGTRYMSALEWGYNGMHDARHWTGAIAAYDYTLSSRRTAYGAIGHVVHLVQDMAQPDHPENRPHPGNDPRMARSLSVLYPTIETERKVGYERLWELQGTWPRGQQPRKPASYQEAFDSMALLAMARAGALGLPRPDEVALGLGKLEVLGRAVRPLDLIDPLRIVTFGDNLWARYEANLPFVPTIPTRPQNERTAAYLRLGHELLPAAEEATAGLLQLFYDIVNPPPYVERVIITQGGVEKYRGEWMPGLAMSDVLSSRRLETTGGVLLPGVPATVSITFGPRIESPGNILHKRVQVRRVGLEADDAEVHHQRTGPDGTWEGTFTPWVASRLVIDAVDIDPHYHGRSDPRGPRLPAPGESLDAEPGTPAKVIAFPPYNWAGYVPGADRNHRFDVGEVACGPDALDLRQLEWAEISGTVAYDYVRELVRPGRRAVSEWMKWSGEVRANAGFETLDDPDGPIQRAHFGGGSRGTASATEGGIYFDSPWGPVNRSCDLMLEGELGPWGPGDSNSEYRIHLTCGDSIAVSGTDALGDPAQPFEFLRFSGLGHGAIEDRACGTRLTGSYDSADGSEVPTDRLTWNFTIRPVEPPLFVATCRDLSTLRPLMDGFDRVLRNALGPASGPVVSRMLMEASAELASEALQLRDAFRLIRRGCDGELRGSWLTHSIPDDLHDRALAEWELELEAWMPRWRQFEATVAARLESIASRAPPAEAGGAQALRDLARRIRDEGLTVLMQPPVVR